MYSRRTNSLPLVAVLGAILVGGVPAWGGVGLRWQPPQQLTAVGEFIEIALMAVSEDSASESFTGLQAVVTWDPTKLSFLGIRDPCEAGPCPANAYRWSSIGLPTGGENDSLDDGEIFLTAFGQFSPPFPTATVDGLLVVYFRFEAVGAGLAEVALAPSSSFGNTTKVSGIGPSVTGTLGPPAEVTVIGCGTPTVAAIGSRYVAITPEAGVTPVALLVEGEAIDPDVDCLSAFVQLDGRLGATPVFRLAEAWGVMSVGDRSIIPSAVYSIRSACGVGGEIQFMSDPVSVTTWRWGDVNGNGDLLFEDISLVFNGSQGIFNGGTMLENLDLSPCTPDGVIDDNDIADVQAAFSGNPFPCVAPCADAPGLSALADLVACMSGPGIDVAPACRLSDRDDDRDVDQCDFADVQLTFSPSVP